MRETFQPKRALISVSDKTHLDKLATALAALGVELISTGGTFDYLKSKGFSVLSVSDITKFPEIMGGRIKTLHPLLLGGVLGRRDVDGAVANEMSIPFIDIVVCNLYPFSSIIAHKDCTINDAIEMIDIGGPTMIRAAAKNYKHVAVLSSSTQYDDFISRLSTNNINESYRQHLAVDVFKKTMQYDQAIAEYFSKFQEDSLTTLRYGENPHQKATCTNNNKDVFSILNAKTLQGKALSYNNIVDGQAALDCVAEFQQPACCIVKHATPSGVAISDDINEAFKCAFNADSMSAFGGIIALNKHCDEKIAAEIIKNFAEVLVAPGFTKEALAILQTKKNLRVMQLDFLLSKEKEEKRFIPGGYLTQDINRHQLDTYMIKQVSGEENFTANDDLVFAWKVVKHVKSNAICIVKDGVTLGISGGQVSRIDAVLQALNKCQDRAHGAVLASDAFFPFRDSVDTISRFGIKAIIQPGGSIKDKEVIDACNELGMTMFFTGYRCFKH